MAKQTSRHSTGTTTHKKHNRNQHLAGSVVAAIVVVCAIVGVILAHTLLLAHSQSHQVYIQGKILPQAYAPTGADHINLPHQRMYFIEQKPQGTQLMASDVAGAQVPLALLPENFGTVSGDVISEIALSPNNRYLAINGQRDHGDSVWIVATETSELRTVPSDALGNFLHWLPDGQHFLFRPTLQTGPGLDTWSPGVWIVDAATGNHVNVTLPDSMLADNLIDAVPSPDGTQILFSVTAGIGNGSTVWTMRADGQQTQRLFHADNAVGQFAWSPSGKTVAYQDIVDTAVPFRPANVWLLTPATTERHQIGTADGGHGYSVAWSPDSQQLAFVTRLNPDDGTANTTAGALQSGITLFSMATGVTSNVVTPAQTGVARNINPVWQTNGSLLFTAMPASEGYGAALTPASLWSVSTSGTASGSGTTTTMTVHRLSMTSDIGAGSRVIIVP